MNAGRTNYLAHRPGYLNLLQIGGACSIVAFHIGIPFSHAGWIAVELFFVIAGFNMVAACDRNEPIAVYAWSRMRRLFPELCMVWCVVVLFVIIGSGTAGMLWFVGTAPFFFQNLTLPFFEYSPPRDWVFAPLWFVGALIQLQLLLFASKRWWSRAKPSSVIMIAVCVGLSSRLLFTLFFGDDPRTLSPSRANALYCLPVSHIEAIVLGLLMGRGALPVIGRCLPLFGALAIVLGMVSVLLSQGLVSPRSLGFEFPLRLNYIHIWGYSILAFAVASLCAENGPFAVATGRMKRPLWLDKGLARLASLTCGVYLFHGIVMATGINGSGWLKQEHAPVLRLLLFAITIIEAFLLAWVFAWFMQVVIPMLSRIRLKAGRLGSGESREKEAITSTSLESELR